MLPAMLHHTIRTCFPHVWAAHDGDAIAAGPGDRPRLQAMYQDWLAEVGEGGDGGGGNTH